MFNHTIPAMALDKKSFRTFFCPTVKERCLGFFLGHSLVLVLCLKPVFISFPIISWVFWDLVAQKRPLEGKYTSVPLPE